MLILNYKHVRTAGFRVLRESIFPSLGSFICQLIERIYFSISWILHFPDHWEAAFSISGTLRLSAHWEALFFHLLDPSFVSSLRDSSFSSLGYFVCQEFHFFISPLSGVTESLYFSISRILRLSAHLEAPFFYPLFVRERGHWRALFFYLWDPLFVRDH